MEECCGLEFQHGAVTHDVRAEVFRTEEKREVPFARVQSELDIKLQENETASETRLTDAASVVRWWQTRVRVARTRARLLARTDEREGFTAHKRHTREQLILGLSVHFGAIDGVSQEGCEHSAERFPRVTAAHARWLSKVASANPAAVVPQLPDVKGVFPRRIRAEDAWRVMRGFCLRRFHYCPGDVVQVRGTDMEWYPGVVTYSRSYADGIESERVAPLEDHPRARAEMMVNVVRPNGMIEFGNKADEVRPHEAGVRVLFGRAPWLWQQHALLHAEKMARFEPDHHHDFNEIAWMAYGRDSFAAWIDGPPRPDGVDDAEWEAHLARLPPTVYARPAPLLRICQRV